MVFHLAFPEAGAPFVPSSGAQFFSGAASICLTRFPKGTPQAIDPH
jgi:hypothetical protein